MGEAIANLAPSSVLNGPVRGATLHLDESQVALSCEGRRLVEIPRGQIERVSFDIKTRSSQLAELFWGGAIPAALMGAVMGALIFIKGGGKAATMPYPILAGALGAVMFGSFFGVIRFVQHSGSIDDKLVVSFWCQGMPKLSVLIPPQSRRDVGEKLTSLGLASKDMMSTQ